MKQQLSHSALGKFCSSLFSLPFFNFVRKVIHSPKMLSIAIVIISFVWIVVIGEHKNSLKDKPSEERATSNRVNSVQVKTSQANAWQPSIVTQGQLEPWRRVTVTSQVRGRVLSIEKQQGDPVAKNEVLARISDEGRAAQVKQAEADLEFATLELESAKTLKSSRFVSAAELSRFKAQLASAQARLDTAKLNDSYGSPNAPFAGMVDRRHIEEGDQLRLDQALFDVVQIDKLRVTAFVPQQKVEKLVEGQEVDISLLDGSELKGELIFISAAADEATRAYYIEIAVENSELNRIAGASATITLPLASTMSHSVSPALLNLDERGKLGLYLVNDNNIVEYHNVTLLSIGDDAIIQGLPETARIITVGAGFVDEGQTVTTSEAP